MKLIVLLISLAVLALVAILCNVQLKRENEGLREVMDYYEDALEKESLVVIDVDKSAKEFKRMYERQLEINNKLMERMKRYGY